MLQTINKSPWLIGIYLVCFMERFVYYGLRASLVIYAIDDTGLGMEGVDALELIGYVYLASLVGSGIGAILQDYVFKSPSGTMLGGGLIIIGATILTLMPESGLFWVAVFTLIFGSGILRIGLDTLVARLYLKQDSSRVFGYLGQNVAISFGAALGTIIIGYLGEEVEYRYAFYLIGLLALLITGVAQILFARLPILEVNLSPVFQDESSSSILDDGFVNKKSSISAFTWAFTFAFFMQIFAFCFGWVEQASLGYYETLTTGHWGFLVELERGIISFVAFLIGIGSAFVLFSKTWSWPIWRYGSLSFFSLFLAHILITQIPWPILDETFGLVALSFICLQLGEAILGPLFCSWLTRISPTVRTGSVLLLYYVGLYTINLLMNELGIWDWEINTVFISGLIFFLACGLWSLRQPKAFKPLPPDRIES